VLLPESASRNTSSSNVSRWSEFSLSLRAIRPNSWKSSWPSPLTSSLRKTPDNSEKFNLRGTLVPRPDEDGLLLNKLLTEERTPDVLRSAVAPVVVAAEAAGVEEPATESGILVSVLMDVYAGLSLPDPDAIFLCQYQEPKQKIGEDFSVDGHETFFGSLLTHSITDSR
jgi:hypothetical protein